MPIVETTIVIGGKSETIHRLKLRGWAELESIKGKMDDAVSRHDLNDYYIILVEFVEMALSTKIQWDDIPWYELVTTYMEVIKLNTPTVAFPLLEGTGKETKKQPWEYPGRSWYFWANLFSRAYGWNLDKIGELEIDDAIGLYQEVLIDDQFQKEWQWGLTEIAYQYNSSTKKSEFKALDRPKWMLPMAPKSLPIVKIRKDMMPMGNIVDLSGKGIKND